MFMKAQIFFLVQIGYHLYSAFTLSPTLLCTFQGHGPLLHILYGFACSWHPFLTSWDSQCRLMANGVGWGVSSQQRGSNRNQKVGLISSSITLKTRSSRRLLLFLVIHTTSFGAWAPQRVIATMKSQTCWRIPVLVGAGAKTIVSGKTSCFSHYI